MLFVEPKKDNGGAVRVGMVWGGIGGVIGFLFSLLGSFVGILASVFVGISCGRRAARADAGKRHGAISGLIGGSLAAPVFVLGAAAGAVIVARQVGGAELARTLSQFAGIEISAEEAWSLYVVSLIFAGFIQAALLVGVATLAGALTARKRR